MTTTCLITRDNTQLQIHKISKVIRVKASWKQEKTKLFILEKADL